MAGGTTSCSVRSKALSAPWGAEAAPAPWTGPWVDVCTEHCLWGLGSIRREGAVGWQRPHSCPSSPHMPGPATGTVPRNSHINPSGTPYSPILWMGTLRTAAEGIPARQEGVRAGSGPRWAGDRPLCSTMCHTAPCGRGASHPQSRCLQGGVRWTLSSCLFWCYRQPPPPEGSHTGL